MVLFSREDSVLAVGPDGTVTVDIQRVRDKARSLDMVHLTRWYVDVRPRVFEAMSAVDDVLLARMTDRDQTRMPVVTEDGELTGREIVAKSSSGGNEVDEELLEEAQRVFRREGVRVTLVERERSLLLDPETMRAFGITEESLKQYLDKIRMSSKRKDVRTLKKAAQMGGVGGDLIRRAIRKKKGHTVIRVEGSESDAPMEEDPGALGGEL
jgi:hypothetical protein